MSYYQQRRAELLGSRKRKPRRCDVRRQQAKERSERSMRAYRAACANRLAAVLL